MSGTTVDPKVAMAFRAAELLDKLVADPKHGLAAKRLIKEINPAANFPELETEDRVNKLVEERTSGIQSEWQKFRDEQAEAKKKSDDARLETDFEKRLNTVRDKYRFTPEGMEKIVERMKDQNSPDVEAAAAWINEQTPKPAPATGPNYLPQTLDLYGSQSKDEAFRLLHENPNQYFDQQVRDILSDPSLAA